MPDTAARHKGYRGGYRGTRRWARTIRDATSMWDDDRPKPKAGIAAGDDLSSVSIAELEQRVVALVAEIERTRAEIDRKKKIQAAATDLFR